MTGPADYRGYPGYDERRESGRRPTVAAGRLWATGVATAAVAALAAVVVTLLVRGVFGVAVFAPRHAGAWGDATTGYLAAVSAGAALVATGLLHLLLVTTAEPRRFFVCITSLVTVAMMLLPFANGLGLAAEFGTAAVYLAVGAAVTGLLSAAAGSVV
ncbi:DUF6069 family protein [Streptantibioticus cattleyicolor]|uniref:Uncharacterized protein n=1 Tax=Streptantibioticus cattleyicolor (strain ATCC 35852 / DSM 46488 / JCM 4925 / NBRC 14057 / NRRL 8057) TaxID=1003195 RepID=F8JL75_STREN|nr:DUF6069 family protein [Streptantibioticus cattleyicolor]AEW98344.1 hypothetical protein SCATT_p01510 [Streptantibioticus cattleyicolor NRRL 8057 = DSM 46488]CCB72598.1 conserved membrane protein of unknown function [Streptantibioticus cattleyicolor NRRL 8057 = DSM 46488]